MKPRPSDPKPRRSPLDPDVVVQAAFEVLDAEGLDNLTVRRIAERLGVQNPALYWHFRNKQEIIDRMAEHMLAEAQVDPAAHATWGGFMLALARAFRRTMLAHRDGARIVAMADLSLSPMTAKLETALALLMDVGFEGKDALLGLLALFDYTLGATLEEQADPIRNAPVQAPPTPADGSRLQTLLLSLAGSWDAGTTFEGGVQLLIDGLATRLSRRPP